LIFTTLEELKITHDGYLGSLLDSAVMMGNGDQKDLFWLFEGV
jgi:hypothetical protein